MILKVTKLFSILIDDENLKESTVSEVMEKPFPFVNPDTSIEIISNLITRENSAILLRELSGKVHIITKQDIIHAISQKI